MRKIAKAGVALATAVTVMGLTAGPASASTGSWTSWGPTGTNLAGVYAWGKWSKSSTYIYVNGYIKDTAADGRSAAIIIRTRNRAGTLSQGVIYYNYHGAGTTAQFNYYKSPYGYTAAAYTKECVGYRTSTGGFKLTKCATNYKRIV